MTVKNGMIVGFSGALLTLAGDILIGANSTSELITGRSMIDMFMDAVGNSDFRMALGGMLGAIGIPLEGVDYLQIWKMLKNEHGIMPKIYLVSALAGTLIGGIIGNGIGTGGISFGHLWMFGMMTAKLQDTYKTLGQTAL